MCPSREADIESFEEATVAKGILVELVKVRQALWIQFGCAADAIGEIGSEIEVELDTGLCPDAIGCLQRNLNI